MNSAFADFEKVRQQSVTIIGAGNTGCALAADLKHRGFSVCLYGHSDHAQRLRGISSREKMTYTGIIEGECLPDMLTTDIGAALSFSSQVILALPSYAQEDMFEGLAPHIQNHHTIINLNGNFSSYILAKMVEERSPVIVETNCAPHASRACCNGDVEIMGVKKFLPIAALGGKLSDAAKDKIAAIIPSRLEWHPDIVAVSMQAYNGVLHPAPMIMNVERIAESIDPFLFYADGITEPVGQVVEAIDKERLDIARMYGHENLRTTLEALSGIYEETGFNTISEFAKNAKVYQNVCAPTHINNRYISEDVPFILVPWYLLGQRMGYEAKAIKEIIDLSSSMHGTNFLETGRTLEKMLLPSQASQGLNRQYEQTRQFA